MGGGSGFPDYYQCSALVGIRERVFVGDFEFAAERSNRDICFCDFCSGLRSFEGDEPTTDT